MRIYTVHELAGAPVDGAGIVFVKEGFCWPALFFAVPWLIFRQLWLALAVFLVVTALVAALVEAAGLGPEGVTACSVALQLLLAFEANDIRRWNLARRGYRTIAVTGGRTQDEAERDFFRRWHGPASASVRSPAPAARPVWPRRRQQEDHGVIGLFPKAEG
jgi:hypothetical protein